MCDETCSWEFCANWIPQILVAAGTIGTVIVALYGGWLKEKLAPPKLIISLQNSKGEKSPITLTDPVDGKARDTISRWYHIRVENKRRWSPAHQVQVFLIRLETKDASGVDKVAWIGQIPLVWQHQAINPLLRTIGYPANADLCNVVKDKWVELQVLYIPHALITRYRDKCHIICTFQAHGVDADSNLLRVEIAWNGKWDEDADQMSNHMVVRDITPTS